MHSRTAPIVLATLAALALTGCVAAVAPASPSALPITQAPRPTPIATPTLPPAPVPTPTPIQGGVDGATDGPELSVEAVDGDTIKASLVDAGAKAWRLVVEGTGALAGERWEILVETSDIEPLISATEIRDGVVVDVMDLTGFGDGTAAFGGCHSVLPVCLDSLGFGVPADGDGTFSVLLDLPEPGVPLSISGGTAGWPSEPFVLGPWTDTGAFPWRG